MKKGIIIGLVLFSVIGCMGQTQSGKEKIQELKAMGNQKEIYLAGGCFWGTEHFMKQIRGVTATQVGYANSTVANPTYQQVCSGRTGAVETVKVVYNPAAVGLPLLLDLYFKTIDPTSLNRQGNDKGTQYRTGIYYTDPSDRALIEKRVDELAKQYDRPLALEVKPLTNFYIAEGYHQEYLEKNPGGYCHINPALFDTARQANFPSAFKDSGIQQGLKEGIVSPRTYSRPDTTTLKKILSSEQYAVTQKNATEPPFQNEYWDERREGIYIDITTGEPLFVSADKFDSGCGWPSFSKPIDKSLVEEKLDTSHGMRRVEVRSKTGDAHLGHVFTDGPKERGGLRYCINSASLRFIPKDRMIAEGYGEYLPLLERPKK